MARKKRPRIARVSDYCVSEVTREQCAAFVLDIHYAGRWPSISYAFGLWTRGELVGVVTYGTPPSPPLRRGIAGDAYIPDILELNRLCLLKNIKNEASILVGKSLKLLPRGKIIVSYADISKNHVGVVYQATNFIYCGLSAKRTDWRIKGKEHLHGQTITDQFRGVENRAAAARELYGDDFCLVDRPRKHRYIKPIGSKRYVKTARAALKYKEQPYPKSS